MSVSGPVSGAPSRTAPTSRPVATAKTAGRTPRRSSTAHHAAARPGAAFGRTAKNCSTALRRGVRTCVTSPAVRGRTTGRR